MARAFKTEDDFSTWLEKNGATEKELLVRCFKKHAQEKGIGYVQALDVALCWGWIDGVRRSLDADSFVQRFTPRKETSYWSAVNLKKYALLKRAGRIKPPGAAAFARRPKDAGSRYSFEREQAALTTEMVERFRKSPKAWAWFENLAPGYRRTSLHWVMSAKQQATRDRRLSVLISCASQSSLIPLLRKP